MERINRDDPKFCEPLLPLRDEIVAALPEYGEQIEHPIEHYLDLLRRVVHCLDVYADQLPREIAGV